jgi:hypothetical protein
VYVQYVRYHYSYAAGVMVRVLLERKMGVTRHEEDECECDSDATRRQEDAVRAESSRRSARSVSVEDSFTSARKPGPCPKQEIGQVSRKQAPESPEASIDIIKP